MSRVVGECRAAGSGKHCWHRDSHGGASVTYTTNPPQWDEVCCHCGASERRTEKAPAPPPGHGPHHPWTRIGARR